MCSVFSLQPQWWFKAVTPMTRSRLGFWPKSPYHTVFLTCLSPAHCDWSPHWGLWALVFVLATEYDFWDGEVFSWTGWMLCVLVWSPRGLASTLITGTWGHHIFKYLERYASQNKEYNVAFEHFLVSCCSFGVCKFHNTGNQNLFSLWLTIV